MKKGGPPSKAKHSSLPIEEVPRGKGEKNRGSGVKKNLKPNAYKQSEPDKRVTACLLKNEPASYFTQQG